MGKITKVVVCGYKGVGKTAILEQLINGNVTKTTDLHPTIEDIYIALVETDRGTRERMRFYDTGGVDQFNANQFIKQGPALADGYILVYDTNQPESLDVLISIKKDIERHRDKKEVSVIILGNRTKPMEDGTLEDAAVKAQHWATREKIKHFEVNAMNRTSLYEPFVYLVSKLNPPANKSSFPQLSNIRKSIVRPDAQLCDVSVIERTAWKALTISVKPSSVK